jgi:hypothetical protein
MVRQAKYQLCYQTSFMIRQSDYQFDDIADFSSSWLASFPSPSFKLKALQAASGDNHCESCNPALFFINLAGLYQVFFVVLAWFFLTS